MYYERLKLHSEKNLENHENCAKYYELEMHTIFSFYI